MLLAVSVAYAGGDSKGAKATPADKAAWFQKELGLNESQTQQVQAVFEQAFKKYDQLEASGTTGDALYAEKKKVKGEVDAKLKNILTADQWTKLEQIRAEHMKHEGKKQ
jgi:hypothetical protein